ncbi:MAG: hypothetical protein WD824_16020 [Cyclobacteriaceae bacterium]
MKKNIILGVAFFLMSLQQLAAQNSIQPNASVAKRFEESFEGAKNVQWVSLPKKVTQAQFGYKGGSWLAYFDDAGNLITFGRRVKSINDLPLKVQDGLRRAKSRLEKKSPAFEIAIIYEMMKDEATLYYVTMQNDASRATFSINTDGMAKLENKKSRTVEPKVPKKAPKDAIARKN